MNTIDKLKSGHKIVLQTLEEFPETAVGISGACGAWSVKDIMAHLASYECMLVDVVNIIVGGSKTPNLERLWSLGSEFNESEVRRYKEEPLREILDEFNAVHAQTLSVIARIPPEICHRTGTIPWCGAEYDLDDFIAEHYYGHKREHAAQIAAFGDLVKGETPGPEDVLTQTTLRVTRLMENAINRREIDALMALIADDCVFENTSPSPDGERLEGQGAIRAFWGDLFGSTRHIDFQTEETFAYANQCTARWIYRWENDAGESGHIRGIDVIDVRNGKVVRNFSYVKG